MKMEISNILRLLKITFNLLLIVLAILLIDTLQRLMGINCHAEYTFEVIICSQISNLGTFCLVLMLLLIGSWGILINSHPNFGEHAKIDRKQLRIIILLIIIILVIGMAIVGGYFAQRIDRWSF